jgi:hypothetical protein
VIIKNNPQRPDQWKPGRSSGFTGRAQLHCETVNDNYLIFKKEPLIGINIHKYNVADFNCFLSATPPLFTFFSVTSLNESRKPYSNEKREEN